MSAPPVSWAPDEIRRFFRAFHKYGTEFDKVSKMVGAGKGQSICETLYRRHQAYLNLDKKFQSEVAFVAMVEDSINKPDDLDDMSEDDGGYGSLKKRSREDYEDGDDAYPSDLDDDLGGGGYASPVRSKGRAVGGESYSSPNQKGGTTLAASRPRRTPKRPIREAGMSRTPQSVGKRSARLGGVAASRDDDIYEFYDEGAAMHAITDSARKRRAAAVAKEAGSQRRLDFNNDVGGRRGGKRDELDDKGAIEALFALAGNESIEEDEPISELEEESGEEGRDNNSDEDYMGNNRRRRKRVKGSHTTPDKNRYRPGSAHATPGRGGRHGTSPGSRGFGSPGWLNNLGDKTLMEDADATYQHLAQLAMSPGFGGKPPPGGFAPSPQHPLPRLRRRKFAVERSAQLPLKTLLNRRQSLTGTSALLSTLGGTSTTAAVASAGGESAAPMTPAEASLRHALHERARKWAACEFFYSALDRPWFMHRPMQDVLNHMGLGRLAKMRKSEWNIIRAALGKPRRLSQKFLHEQRAKLEKWRETVREYYDTETVDVTISATMPKALTVGQRVTARHPSTRQLHDGSVLTVAHNCYRIQFDRRELGVELIKDTDVMPCDPFESLPPAIIATRPSLVLNGRAVKNGIRCTATLPPGVVRPSASGGAGNVTGGKIGDMDGVLSRPATGLRHDIQAMAELAVSLDKKEALLTQLRTMNNEAQAGVHTDANGATTQDFAQAYASVVLGLRDTSAEVADKVQKVEGNEPNNAVPQQQQRPATAEEIALDAAVQRAAAAIPSLDNPDWNQSMEQVEAIYPPNPAITTAQALAQSTFLEAQRVVSTCKANLTTSAAAQDGAATAGPDAGGKPLLMDWESEEGMKLSRVIGGAVWLLVMLQHGAEAEVPMEALAGALDTSLTAVKPRSEANLGLHGEIKEAMEALKAQLLAV